MAEQYLSRKKKNFFQGWYFKQSDGLNTVSFIPGFALDAAGNRTPFIQVIDNYSSAFVDFTGEDFHCEADRLFVRIGANEFSPAGIKVDMETSMGRVQGELSFEGFREPARRFLCPNVMGWFDYIPALKCRHYIYSLSHLVSGSITVGDKETVFDGAPGYCEGDRGSSFPRSYFWAQTNHMEDGSCLMLAVAEVDMAGLRFGGHTGVISLGGKTKFFSTYNFARLEYMKERGDGVSLRYKMGRRALEVELSMPLGSDLKSPHKGVMSGTIKEAVSARMDVKYFKGKKLIYFGDNLPCTAENVGKLKCSTREKDKVAFKLYKEEKSV